MFTKMKSNQSGYIAVAGGVVAATGTAIYLDKKRTNKREDSDTEEKIEQLASIGVTRRQAKILLK